MKKQLTLSILLLAYAHFSVANAQPKDNFDLLQPISIENQPVKKIKVKKKKIVVNIPKIKKIKPKPKPKPKVIVKKIVIVKKAPQTHNANAKILKVNFASGKAKIKNKKIDDIVSFAKYLAIHPKYKAVIYGYTDSIGSAKNNKKLSQKRAESVKQALIMNGIKGKRITAIGEGEKDPVASNSNKAGRKKNRRIEVVVVKL